MKSNYFALILLFMSSLSLTFSSCGDELCDGDEINIFSLDEPTNRSMAGETIHIHFTKSCQDTLLQDTISLNTYTFNFNEAGNFLDLSVSQDFQDGNSPTVINSQIAIDELKADYIQRLENERVMQMLLCLIEMGGVTDSLACAQKIDEHFPIPDEIPDEVLMSYAIEEELGIQVPPVYGDTTLTTYAIKTVNQLCEDFPIKEIYALGSVDASFPIESNEQIFVFGDFESRLTLSPHDTQSTFIFEWHDERTDTLALTYTIRDQYVSEKCGYMVFFENVEVSHMTFPNWEIISDNKFKIHIDLKN